MTTGLAELHHKEPAVSVGDDDMSQYLREIRRFPLLTPEEERTLAMACKQGDEDAIRQMVSSNLRLVVSVAREYAGRGVLATGPWRGEPVGRIARGDMIENGYMLWAEPYDTQSDADRAAHKAMPIHAALCFAGSVESLIINIDVTM